jgi:mRNA interferase RelE/StbE
MRYTIEIIPSALEMLKNIQDRRVREKIIERIDGLAEQPEKQGKALAAELDEYRSLRAVGQRYRIIYRIDGEKVVVVVVAVGIRKEGDKKDIYTLAQKLIRARLLEPPVEESPAEDQPSDEQVPRNNPASEEDGGGIVARK